MNHIELICSQILFLETTDSTWGCSFVFLITRAVWLYLKGRTLRSCCTLLWHFISQNPLSCETNAKQICVLVCVKFSILKQRYNHKEAGPTIVWTTCLHKDVKMHTNNLILVIKEAKNMHSSFVVCLEGFGSNLLFSATQKRDEALCSTDFSLSCHFPPVILAMIKSLSRSVMWSAEDSKELRRNEVTCKQMKVHQQIYSECLWYSRS